MMRDDQEIEYGNWVSSRMMKSWIAGALIADGLCVLSFSALTASWASAARWIIQLLLVVLTLAFILATAYFYVCRALFSYDGEYRIQSKILDYVVAHFECSQGRILDIGCGNGALSIKTAKRFPASHITGVDYWGSMWNFAQEQCERNADLEGVGDRIAFQKGDAAKLDFPDEYFDGAVSNFVFHEVKSQRDKRLVVREALRVVKKGGTFAFHDLFLEKKFYGNIEEFIDELRKEGIDHVSFLRSSDESFIPKILKTGFMLGRIGLIYGRK